MQQLDGHWVAKRIGIIEHYKTMTLAEIVLFDAYLLLSNKQTWECWATIEQIQETLPMARRTILYAKKKLMERGWIETAGKSGVFIPKLFRYADKVQNGHSKVQNGHSPYPDDFSAKVQNGHSKVQNRHREFSKVQNRHSKVQNRHHIIEEENNIIEDDILGMSENSENSGLCKLELPYLHLLKSIPGYTFNFEKDLSFIRDVLTDFPEMDISKEIKNWKTWLLDKSLKGKINYRSRLRRWLQNSIKYKEEKAHEKRGYNSGQSEADGQKRGVVGRPGRKGFDLPSDYPIDAGDDYAGEDQSS